MGLRAPGAPGRNPYDMARERAQQRASQTGQKNAGAIARRFAAIGGLNSGAAIKAQQMAHQQADQQREDAVRDVDIAEGQMAQQQAHQSSEAEKARQFQADQAGQDRGFQEKVFSFDKESKLKQLDLAFQQFDLQKDESAFNRRLARYQAGQSGGLFGGGGFLGTGIGAGPVDI